MLDERTRASIFVLREQGHGTRAIADVLGVSRGSVKRVLREGRVEIPKMARAEKAEPFGGRLGRSHSRPLFRSARGARGVVSAARY
jgi:IS30 family transposase